MKPCNFETFCTLFDIYDDSQLNYRSIQCSAHSIPMLFFSAHLNVYIYFISYGIDQILLTTFFFFTFAERNFDWSRLKMQLYWTIQMKICYKINEAVPHMFHRKFSKRIPCIRAKRLICGRLALFYIPWSLDGKCCFFYVYQRSLEYLLYKWIMGFKSWMQNDHFYSLNVIQTSQNSDISINNCLIFDFNKL